MISTIWPPPKVLPKAAFSADTNNSWFSAAALGIIPGAAIVIPPAIIIVIIVRLVILRPISLFMLLTFLLKFNI